MTVTIHVPKPDTPQRRLEASEYNGRPIGGTAGSHLSDLAALGKLTSLCPLCVGKWHPRAQGYELWRSVFTAARCDACRAQDIRCKSFIPESLHAEVGDTRPRYRGRWASRQPRDVGRKIPS